MCGGCTYTTIIIELKYEINLCYVANLDFFGILKILQRTFYHGLKKGIIKSNYVFNLQFLRAVESGENSGNFILLAMSVLLWFVFWLMLSVSSVKLCIHVIFMLINVIDIFSSVGTR